MAADRRLDRVAIVTGASSGIGRATACRLAAESTRLCLVAAPADEAELEATAQAIAAAGGVCLPLAADVADASTAQHAVDAVLERYGRVDLLASNAGIAFVGPMLDEDVGVLDRTLAVNVRGSYLMMQAAARAMAERGGGSIVCTASTAALMGEENEASYNASKAAVMSLVKSLAVELAPFAIRVNAVAPGWTRTRATAWALDDPDVWGKRRSQIPLDRPAEPEEIAAAICFLLGDDASYVTGVCLPVDGGMLAGFRSA